MVPRKTFASIRNNSLGDFCEKARRDQDLVGFIFSGMVVVPALLARVELNGWHTNSCRPNLEEPMSWWVCQEFEKHPPILVTAAGRGAYFLFVGVRVVTILFGARKGDKTGLIRC